MQSKENTEEKEEKVVIRFEGSLRQYYAGQAMMGLLAGGRDVTYNGVSSSGSEAYAFSAVRYADALLAELSKSN